MCVHVHTYIYIHIHVCISRQPLTEFSLSFELRLYRLDIWDEEAALAVCSRLTAFRAQVATVVF